ncbi:uncharacterized protein [Littorina saxatilis]|uniref:uncharacterized protein n=1 Tax=Littorina saxatilis TaxID=31220 RepID=UPI0038B698B9
MHFVAVCEEGTYGEGCSMECGKCTHSCRHDDGLCIGGCFDGYAGPYCAQTSSPNLAGPVAGAVFGGLCVIALSILLVGLLIRRSRKRSSSEKASPPPTSANQRFEPGAPDGLNGQAGLQETGSAGVAEAEENHYEGLQTPDDSDRDPYSTPVFNGH